MLLRLTLVFSAVVFSVFAWGEEDPPEVVLGEKLFREYRFSEFFYRESKGKINTPLKSGDPALETLETDLGIFEHPYRGKAMSCAACHLVDQMASVSGRGALTYNDFAKQTPFSLRSDGLTKTTRNTSNMVGSMIREGLPLHWDGEFFSGKDLACASLTGRNMGWLPGEEKAAKAHIVNVLRKDDGTLENDVDLKLSYLEAFRELGIHIEKLSDEKVFDLSCEFIFEYMKSLDFAQDEEGYTGSAYDRFLQTNGLRRAPRSGQSVLEYVEELRKDIMTRTNWTWIMPEPMQYHPHPAQFGDLELEGMRIFFGKGQCATCHTPPHFTDFGFHATGITQLAYDQVHGYKSFANLKIPTWAERLKKKEIYFVSSEENPTWQGVFRRSPSVGHPLFADLGVWNMFGHPDKSSIQTPLKEAICRSLGLPDCAKQKDEELLDRTVGMFKTPTLRSLGQSAPYFSDGSASSLRNTLQVYMVVSAMAKRGLLVNADPSLQSMSIRHHDFPALHAFLQALDEDYD